MYLGFSPCAEEVRGTFYRVQIYITTFIFSTQMFEASGREVNVTVHGEGSGIAKSAVDRGEYVCNNDRLPLG